MRVELESLEGGFIFHNLPMRLWKGHILTSGGRVPLLLLNNTILTFTPNAPDVEGPQLAEMAPRLPAYPHKMIKGMNMQRLIDMALSWER